MAVQSDLYFKMWDEYTVRDVRARHGREFIDLSSYNGLTNKDVCEALQSAADLGTTGIIIPDYRISGTGELYGNGTYFWDKGGKFKVKGNELDARYRLRFMRFGDHIDLTKSNTTLRQIRDGGYTPRKLFKDVLGDGENRVKLLEGSYRGIGWWDPKSRKHKLLPFDVPVEGEEFMRMFGGEMRFKHQRADAKVTVPSVSRKYEGHEGYMVIIRVLPVTAENGAFHHEWLMTEVVDGCEDRFYRAISGKAYQEGEMKDVYRYAKPEDALCRHGWGSLLKAEERSVKAGKPFLLSYPRVKDAQRNVYRTLNLSTIVKGINGGERRPTKTEAGIQMGRHLGFVGPEEFFDLIE